jgi:hypothetical protein
MSTQPHDQSAEPKPAPPLPDDIARDLEDNSALQVRFAGGHVSISTLAEQGVKAVEEYLEGRERALATLHAVAIKSTRPSDWTRYKDRDGRVICVLRDNGAANIRKWMGISIYNHRGHPLDRGIPGPKVSEEKPEDPSGQVVTVTEMWADAFCSLTGEHIQGVYSAIRSDDKWRGRETLQDQKASTRTYIDTKCTRILSGLRKVPEEMLAGAGLDVEKAYAGSGFGTSAERQAGKVAEAGVKDKAQQLREEILRRVGGDAVAAKDLLRDITKGEKKGPDGKIFPGFSSVDRMTKDWQVDNAWKKLRSHPTFGDDVEREPGQEG